MQIVTAFAMGFIVALVTGMLLSPKKSKRMPGGSIAVGFMVAGWPAALTLFGLGCGIASLTGWYVYRRLVR